MWGTFQEESNTQIDALTARQEANALDVLETPVTVTLQQEISKTLYSSKIP